MSISQSFSLWDITSDRSSKVNDAKKLLKSSVRIQKLSFNSVSALIGRSNCPVMYTRFRTVVKLENYKHLEVNHWF